MIVEIDFPLADMVSKLNNIGDICQLKWSKQLLVILSVSEEDNNSVKITCLTDEKLVGLVYYKKDIIQMGNMLGFGPLFKTVLCQIKS